MNMKTAQVADVISSSTNEVNDCVNECKRIGYFRDIHMRLVLYRRIYDRLATVEDVLYRARKSTRDELMLFELCRIECRMMELYDELSERMRDD
jgi:hypothetical protein